ncbi:MAG: AAA family ATPase [Clostridia bacterium]|nr:AAA family ATPase [Clostridia bacterium]
MKRLILVTSPPASGKTYVSKKLAERLDHVVYLDKDTLIPLSKKVFEAAGEEYNRSSDFFEKYIRDAEYETVVAIAMEALDYADMVLINAPFTKEIRNWDYMENLQKTLKSKLACLSVIWVKTDIDVVKRRMEERNSDRDKWKLENWDEYIAGCDFSIPEELEALSEEKNLFIFENSDDREFHESMAKVTAFLES